MRWPACTPRTFPQKGMHMSQRNSLPDLPEPAVNDWETAPIEDLRSEVRQLRLWCGQLFMSIKNAEVSAAGAKTAAEQATRTADHISSNYIELDNKVKSLDGDLTLIMAFLGMEGE